MLAKSFCGFDEDSQVMVFASGVSNSLEVRDSEFDRERDLLLQCLANISHEWFVYFSTCSIYEPVSEYRPYVRHKLEMEKIIAERSANYAIFRLPQVVGVGGNKHTLLNYLIKSITDNNPFEIWKNATRNFIDVSDIVSITSVVLKELRRQKKSTIMNISSPFTYTLCDVVRIVEEEVGKKANYTLIEKGAAYDIDLHDMLAMIDEIDDIFDDELYLQKLLRKYFI